MQKEFFFFFLVYTASPCLAENSKILTYQYTTLLLTEEWSLYELTYRL